MNTNSKPPTLGDIHRVITELLEQGVNPGSIDWVLRNQVPAMQEYYHQEEYRTPCCQAQAFPDGTCARCSTKPQEAPAY